MTLASKLADSLRVPARTILVMPQEVINADRAAWLARRTEGITGTEVAQLLGISDYGDPFTLYHNKLSGTETGDKPAMRRGRRLEPEVEDLAHDRWPWFSHSPAGLYAHVTDSWRLATLDRWLLDTEAAPAAAVDYFRRGARVGADQSVIDAAVPEEFKTWATRRPGNDPAKWWGKPGTGEVPVGIRAQALWNMDVAGADRIVILVLFMDTWQVEFYELARDGYRCQDDIDLMVASARQYLTEVLGARREPEPSALEASTETLRLLHPDLNDAEVDIGRGLGRRYVLAKAAEAQAKARRRLVGNLIRHRMGSAARAVAPDSTGRLLTVCSRSISDYTVEAHEVHNDRLNPGRWAP